MQINLNKTTGVLVTVIALLVGVIVGISVNLNRDEGFMGMHSDNSMGMYPSSDSAGYTSADIMFLQMMIPHHQQAIDISNIALKKSNNPELIALSKAIIKAQTAEIAQMQLWLKNSKTSAGMSHSMDGMGGMLDDAELSALSAAQGKTFDKLWLEGMIAHHDGAIHMTTMIQDADNPEIKAFGENVVKDQSAQIIQMKAMLTRIG